MIYEHGEVDLNRDCSIKADVPFNINTDVVIDGPIPLISMAKAHIVSLNPAAGIKNLQYFLFA